MTALKENIKQIPSSCRENCPFQENCFSQGFQHCPLQRRSLIYLPLFYSISVHLIILYVILTLPIYSGGYRFRQSSGYSVYLKAETKTADDKGSGEKNVSKPDSRPAASNPKTPPKNLASGKKSLPAVKTSEKPQPAGKPPELKPKGQQSDIALSGTDISEKAEQPSPATPTSLVEQRDTTVAKKEIPDSPDSSVKNTPGSAMPEVKEGQEKTPEPTKSPNPDLAESKVPDTVTKDSDSSDRGREHLSRALAGKNKEKPKSASPEIIKVTDAPLEKTAVPKKTEMKVSSAKTPSEISDTTMDDIDKLDRLKDYGPEKTPPVEKSSQPKSSSHDSIKKGAPQPAESKPLPAKVSKKDHNTPRSMEKDAAESNSKPTMKSRAPEAADKGGEQDAQPASARMPELKGPTIIELSPEIPDAQERQQKLSDSRIFDRKEQPLVAFSSEADDSADIFAAITAEDAKLRHVAPIESPPLPRETAAAPQPKDSVRSDANQNGTVPEILNPSGEIQKSSPSPDAARAHQRQDLSKSWEHTIRTAEDLAEVIQLAIMEKVMHALEQSDFLPPPRKPDSSRREKTEEPHDKKAMIPKQASVSHTAPAQELSSGKVLTFQRPAQPLMLSKHEMAVSRVAYQFFLPVSQAATELTSIGKIDYDPDLYREQSKKIKNIPEKESSLKSSISPDKLTDRNVTALAEREKSDLEEPPPPAVEPKTLSSDEQSSAETVQPHAMPDVISSLPSDESIVDEHPENVRSGEQMTTPENINTPQPDYTLSLPDESREVMLETDLSITQNPLIALDINGGDFPAASAAQNLSHSNLTAADKSSPPALGIPVAEALITKDIKIEMQSYGLELSLIPLSLFVRDKPSVAGKSSRGNKKLNDVADVSLIYREKESLATKRVLSLATAGTGTYTLVVENNSKELMTVDVIFRLYEGKKTERIKEYKSEKIEAGSSLRFKFLLPAVIFWDDEDSFSGSVEDSHSITKFNDETGLVWKEEKDY